MSSCNFVDCDGTDIFKNGVKVAEIRFKVQHIHDWRNDPAHEWWLSKCVVSDFTSEDYDEDLDFDVIETFYDERSAVLAMEEAVKAAKSEEQQQVQGAGDE